jgi:diguanylate cyclase (GGDEF)-like protein
MGRGRAYSLKRKLVVIVLACLLLPTLAVGWLGYAEVQDTIRTEKIRSVGAVANTRHEELVGILQRINARAVAFLSDVGTRCSGRGIGIKETCATEALQSFARSERTEGAVLRLSGTGNDIVVGNSAASLDGWVPLKPGQLARLSTRQAGTSRTYDVAVEDSRRGLRLVLTFPVSMIERLFTNAPELGQSGETFLSDSDGFFVTKARYLAIQGHSHPISARPMQSCLAATDGEVLDQDYRDVAIIHGYRYVPEIGGGCIMAHVDQAEAFAPLMLLRWRMAGLTLLFFAAAVVAARAIGGSIAEPIVRLTEATREIIAGNYDARADVCADDEITELARSFNRMAERLQMTLGELGEQKAQLEQRVLDRTAELESVNLKLEALNRCDGLTGIANRRHLDEVLDAEWRRALRQRESLALMMVDVDHFKTFNDHYGHQEGDECLRQVASVLSARAQRAGELAGRYGGEEFAILHPRANLEDVLACADDVRQAVADLAIPHALSSGGTVTISVGVAIMVPDDITTLAQLICEADKALYQAKRSGRNRVVMADEVCAA